MSRTYYVEEVIARSHRQGENQCKIANILLTVLNEPAEQRMSPLTNGEGIFRHGVNTLMRSRLDAIGRSCDAINFFLKNLGREAEKKSDVLGHLNFEVRNHHHSSFCLTRRIVMKLLMALLVVVKTKRKERPITYKGLWRFWSDDFIAKLT